MNKNCTALIWLLLVMAVLSGCEILEPLQTDVTEEAALEKYKDVPMQKVLNKVQNDFAKAKEQALYFYSPNNYRAAQTGLKTARAYFRDPERKTQVLKSMYKAEEAIKEGFEVKKIVDRELSEVVALRISLNQLDAKRSHGREYRGLATNTTTLIERVEAKKEKLFTDPSEKAKFEEDKKELVASLKDFQLRVVKDKYLSKGENIIAEAERYDAKKLAPVTYGAAVKSMNDSVAYIEKNVENYEGIQEQSQKFEYAALRLMHVTREINNIKNLKEPTYEEYVLRQEKRLGKISDALKAGDLRHQNFSKQSSLLASSAKKLIKQKEDYALAIAEGADSGATMVVPVTSEAAAKPVQQVQQDLGPDPLVAGVAGGDLETLKTSVRLLTDQIYQMTLENSELKGQRDMLKTKVDQLEKKLSQKAPSSQKVNTTEKNPENKESAKSTTDTKSGKTAETK
ncbi:hypothetical protein [Kaarinaea lacus]